MHRSQPGAFGDPGHVGARVEEADVVGNRAGEELTDGDGLDRELALGELRLLLGPQRIEGGWWDGAAAQPGANPIPAARDYWVAHSPRAGLLWVFCTRPVAQQQEPAWYLHGHFA